MSLNAAGEIEWRTQKWFNARGSHDSTLAVKIDGRGDLHISGSPAKFFQGHNLFGSSDVQAIGIELCERVLAEVPGVVMNGETEMALAELRVDVLRVDINETFSTGSRERCHAWLREAADAATMKHRGRGVLDRETVYWGRRSRHFGIKGYCKGHELEQRGHELATALRTEAMLAYADDALRIEVQFNARYLRGLGRGVLSSWQIGDPDRLYVEHLARVNFAGNVRMSPTELSSLPRELRKTYALWQAGEDLRALMSRMTFYRHRRQLLSLGIDIASKQPKSNVVRLLPIIEARPKGIPEWAVGTALYYEPRRRA